MVLKNSVEICNLFDLYGSLLTENQQSIILQYYYQNLSLGEIAANNNITRQAIYDTVKKAITTLENMERKLKLAEKYTEIKKLLNNLEHTGFKESVLNILYR